MRAMRLVALSLMIMVAATVSAAAQKYGITGRVVSTESEPIAYATVVITNDNGQVAGGATNDKGYFALYAAEGDYTLNISYIGYKSQTTPLELHTNVDLGDIRLEDDSEQIQEVVVTAQLIRREADRFVVDVANSPLAMGKDGEELLKSAPGVWIQDDKVSINGSAGSKIYLNEREVKLEDAQLMAYLRSLRASDIQRIEVIPQSGADHDADSSGGIIKITTKRRIDTGLMGSASFSTQLTRGLYSVGPSVSLNYNRGKVNSYGRAWIGSNGSEFISEEHTDYSVGSVIDAATTMKDRSLYGGANVGIVYDINPRHSVGAEVQYNNYANNSATSTWTDYQLAGLSTRTDGDYTSKMQSVMTTATLNYIYKLDDKGSTLKFIGDYNYSSTPNYNSYYDTTLDPVSLMRRDSTYLSDAMSRNHLATATVALEKVLSPKVVLKAGVKYTYNNNGNMANYQYQYGEAWLPITSKSYDIGYSENIGAAYVIASANLGRLSLVGGLRGEYTNFSDKSGDVTQNYFDLFPNANLSYALTKDGAYSLVAQYARTITRPSFWALSPNEIKISEYMIQRGNPNLKPSYDNSVSVTAVLKYKYTITLGVGFKQNAIQQATISDKENPELLIVEQMNFPTMSNYMISANLPFQFTKWWSANFNIMGMYLGQRVFVDEPVRYNFMGYGSAQMSFTLPKEFYIELSGRYMHGIVSGNIRMRDIRNIDIHLKKRMLDNKLTLKVGVRNIIPENHCAITEEAEFKRVMIMDQPWHRPTFNFSVSYNFNTGKQFRAKSVESGSAEDRSRIGSGSSSGQ